MDRELPVSAWPEWKIVEKIGEGSYGKVYKAQRTEKGRSFYSAVKILSIPYSKSELNGVLNETGSEETARNYFEGLLEECIQEINTMEYFRGNSHIVSVEDYKVVEYLDEIGWDISIRMEYLESFIEYCAGRNLTEEEVLKLGIDLCRALEYCAQLNIIHRDIKPENIFVSRFGDFKLGDFGIARELERSMGGFSKKGTYSYMAPELYRGEKYDSRVDIYSLGLVLYKLMNQNRLPFLSLEKQLITYRDKENALNRRMSGAALDAPVQASREFGRVILKACAYDPQDRYQTAAQFRKALERLRDQETDEMQKPEEIEEAGQWEPEELPEEYEDVDAKDERPVRKTVRRQNRRYIRLRAMIPIIIVGVLALGTGANLYIKKVLKEAVREQSQELLGLLENSNSELNPQQVDDFSECIQEIKDHATEIVNNLSDYRREGAEDSILRYYDENGNLMKVLVYPEESEEGVYEEYYYWNNELFFAYIWSGDDEELYYYHEGSLIRWIDKYGESHDNELDEPEYLERGERYWSNALKQAEN